MESQLKTALRMTQYFFEKYSRKKYEFTEDKHKYANNYSTIQQISETSILK